MPSARLQKVDPEQFAFDWTSITMDGFAAISYDLAATVHSSVQLTDQLMACRLASRGAAITTQRTALRAGSPWLASERPVEAEWDGLARVRAFVFDRRAVEQAARTVSGDDRLALRFRDASPASIAAGRQWETGYQYVSTSLAALAGERTDTSILETELRRHAMILTLAAFPSDFTDADRRSPQTRAAPATVRRAIAFMEGHADSAITIDDVARAAGVSTRGLQYAFRRALDTTPASYLRTTRLAGAHEDLRRGARPVATVARRWGFPDASRFAKHYRAVYGVSPRDTARSA